MSKRIKGITIEIDGETKGLQAALSDVNKKSNEVTKELRDVEKLLKFNPGNVELLAQKKKLLADQVSATSEKLKQLKDAQAEVQAQFERGEIGEEQYRAFQREIVETESKLKHYEGQLKETEGKLSSLTDKVKQTGEALKKKGESITSAGTAMTKYVTAPLAAAGAGMIALAKNAGNAADRLLDLEQITGMSTDSLQEWQHVATVAGVNAETMSSAVEGLTKKIPQLEAEGGKATEAMSKLGLSWSELKNLSPDEQVNKMMYALAEMEDVQQRNVIGSQLFGGAWKDLAPILSMGAEGIAAARKEAHDLNLVIGNEALNNSNDFRIEWDKMIKVIQKAAEKIGSDLAPVLRDTLIPIIQDTVIPMIMSFADAIGKLISWFGNLPTSVQQFIMVLTGLLAAAGPVLVIIGTLVSAFGSILTVIGPLIPAIAGIGATIAGIAAPVGIAIAAFAAIAIAIKGFIELGKLIINNWDSISAYLSKTWQSIKDLAVRIFDSVIEFFKKWGSTILVVLLGPIGILVKTIIDNWESIKNKTIEVWNSIINFFREILKNIGETIKTKFNEFVNTVSQILPNMLTKIKEIWNNILNFLKSINLFNVGRDIIQGLINGLASKLNDAKNKALEISKSIKEAIANFFLMRSPSRLMMGMGGDIGKGLEIGMDRTINDISRQADELAKAALPDIQQVDHDVNVNGTRGSSNGSGSDSGSFNIIIQNMNVRDDTDIKLIAREFYNLQRTRDRGLGYSINSK